MSEGNEVNLHLDTFGNYISKFNEVSGLTTPTTCCYQEIKEQECEIIWFFVIQGLGSCVGLEGFMAHHFYAPTFVHNTSVCLAIDSENRVHVTNEQKCWGNMMAWGTHSPTDW